MIILTWLAGVFAPAVSSQPIVQQNAATRAALEHDVASAIATVPGLRVKLVNEPEQLVASAKTSECHTRFRAGGIWYDFDWSTATGGPVRSKPTSFSGFVNGRLAAILIPDGAGNGDRQMFDALFRAIDAYWVHCNPGAAGEDDW